MGFRKHNNPPPKNMIGPRIMCLSKLIRQISNDAWSKQGLFSGQQDLIFILLENEGITLNQLADKLEVSTATASVSVKRMEKSGFIIKKTDKSDARIVRLYPTEKAKASSQEVRKHMDSMEEILHKNLTEEQVLNLTNTLDTAIGNLFERSEKKC